MERILLTGASGFLGKNLITVLSKNYEVVGLDSRCDLRNQIKAKNIVKKIKKSF